MTSLRDRLRQPGASPDSSEGQEGAEPPSPVVQSSHAATKHNSTKREVDMVKFHYGTDSCIALPYSYLATIDMPTPEKLVLEFASRTVTIEGFRLEALMSGLEHRHVAMIRANDNPAFEAGGKEPVIRNVTVKKPD